MKTKDADSKKLIYYGLFNKYSTSVVPHEVFSTDPPSVSTRNTNAPDTVLTTSVEVEGDSAGDPTPLVAICTIRKYFPRSESYTVYVSEVCPVIALHPSVPVELFSHLNVLTGDGTPVVEDEVAVRVKPDWAIPLMVGGDVIAAEEVANIL